jgi:hypothetical protein
MRVRHRIDSDEFSPAPQLLDVDGCSRTQSRVKLVLASAREQLLVLGSKDPSLTAAVSRRVWCQGKVDFFGGQGNVDV